MDNLKKYQDIIKGLSQLKSIAPSEQLKSHFENTLVSALLSKQYNKSLLFGNSFRFAVFMLTFLILGSSGIVLAAEHSQPGSLLYPVKQVVQEAKLAVTGSPSARASLHLEKAKDKVEEIKQSVSDNDDEKLNNSVKGYQDNVSKTIQETQKSKEQTNNTIQIIEQSLDSQTQILQELQITAPTQAQPALDKAIDASQKGQEQVQKVMQNSPSSNTPRPDQTQNPQNQSSNEQSSSSNSQQGQNTAAEHNN